MTYYFIFGEGPDQHCLVEVSAIMVDTELLNMATTIKILNFNLFLINLCLNINSHIWLVNGVLTAPIHSIICIAGVLLGLGHGIYHVVSII